MFHLVYTSQSIAPFSHKELLELLGKSWHNNKKLKITGLLIYLNQRFIQVLEGEMEPVNNLYAIIQQDKRHTKVTTVIEGNTQDRLFKDWWMGFKNLSQTEFTDLSGFQNIDDFFNHQKISEDSNLVLIFLQLFYNKNLVDYPELILYGK